MAHFYGKGWLVDWRFNTSPLSPPPCQLKPEELWGRKGWKLVERNRIPKQEIAMNKFNAFTWICFLAFVSWWFLYFFCAASIFPYSLWRRLSTSGCFTNGATLLTAKDPATFRHRQRKVKKWTMAHVDWNPSFGLGSCGGSIINSLRVTSHLEVVEIGCLIDIYKQLIIIYPSKSRWKQHKIGLELCCFNVNHFVLWSGSSFWWWKKTALRSIPPPDIFMSTIPSSGIRLDWPCVASPVTQPVRFLMANLDSRNTELCCFLTNVCTY